METNSNKLKYSLVVMVVLTLLLVGVYLIVSKMSVQQLRDLQKDLGHGDPQMGSDEEGHEITSYVVDVKEPLPTEAPAQHKKSDTIPNFPLYANATEESSTSWETSDSVSDVMRWYVLAFDDLGWEADSSVVGKDSSTRQSVTVSRGEQTVELTVSRSGNITTISVKEL